MAVLFSSQKMELGIGLMLMGNCDADSVRATVIVPVKNEESNIAALMDSLLSQTLTPDEIIIVDGGSTDRTIDILSDYEKRFVSIKLILENEALPGRGRNLAIQSATNSIIAMTDAGIVLDSNWLDSLVEPIRNDPETQVSFGGWDFFAKTLFEHCFGIIYVPRFAAYGASRAVYETTASLAIRREVWEEIGGFREDLRAAEDLIFLNSIDNLGFNTQIAPAAIAHWRPRSSLKEVAMLASKYAKCDVNSGFHTARHIRKIGIYIFGLFIFCMGFFSFFYLLLLFVMFFLYIAASIRKHALEFVKITLKNPLALPIVISIIITQDISGIVGFIRGIAQRS